MYTEISKSKFLRYLYHEVGTYPTTLQLRLLDELLAGKDNVVTTQQKIKDKAWIQFHLSAYKELQNDTVNK